ncbi:hypothetical protein J6590_079870 [Homalodisca vitripennis]|nr:hypothetical protein J6590_079870 [Homalodisca vitripennis]
MYCVCSYERCEVDWMFCTTVQKERGLISCVAIILNYGMGDEFFAMGTQNGNKLALQVLHGMMTL